MKKPILGWWWVMLVVALWPMGEGVLAARPAGGAVLGGGGLLVAQHRLMDLPGGQEQAPAFGIGGSRTSAPGRAPEATQPLAGLGSFPGVLSPTDGRLSSGEFVRFYSVSGPAGTALTITLRSSQFDTYLLVTGPDGFQEDNDDAPGMGTDSQLELVFPVGGTYRVGVTSYAPGETGAYTLDIRQSTRVLEARQGRVVMVSVGVSRYPRASDLAGTDEDARALFATVRERGVLSPQSVLLVNEQATRASVERAVRAAVREAGPQDVFVFFFSGHGNQVPARGPGELDGMDETIEMVDGAILDRELAAWLAPLRSRLAIIALDSCHAGGFARDVISAPGRLGLFSSEEDVLSLVASSFQAGGYLAFFLREGLAGAADVAPADGVITVGELVHYLREQWAAHGPRQRVEASAGGRTYQHLVVERGVVSMDEVVLFSAREVKAPTP